MCLKSFTVSPLLTAYDWGWSPVRGLRVVVKTPPSVRLPGGSVRVGETRNGRPSGLTEGDGVESGEERRGPGGTTSVCPGEPAGACLRVTRGSRSHSPSGPTARPSWRHDGTGRDVPIRTDDYPSWGPRAVGSQNEVLSVVGYGVRLRSVWGTNRYFL